MGALTFCCSFLLKVICRLCVIYVGGDNDFNVQAMITRLMWTIWTSLSAVRERPLNLITHSLCTLTICRSHLTVHVYIPVCVLNQGCVHRRYAFQGTGVVCLVIIDSNAMPNCCTCCLTLTDTEILLKLMIVPVNIKVGHNSPVQET